VVTPYDVCNEINFYYHFNAFRMSLNFSDVNWARSAMPLVDTAVVSINLFMRILRFYICGRYFCTWRGDLIYMYKISSLLT
jgi:hypothetical protein